MQRTTSKQPAHLVKRVSKIREETTAKVLAALLSAGTGGLTAQMRKAAADAWLDCDSRMVLNKAAAALKAGIAAAAKHAGVK